jgi:restriction system protein
LDVIYIQAKRWKHNIGRAEIQTFVGALAGRKAAKGIFITTSECYDNAREYVAGLHQKIKIRIEISRAFVEIRFIQA